MNQFMTIKELAQSSGLSEYTIRAAVKQGKIASFQLKPKGKYFISIELFQDFINGLETLTKNAKFNNIVPFNNTIRKVNE